MPVSASSEPTKRLFSKEHFYLNLSDWSSTTANVCWTSWLTDWLIDCIRCISFYLTKSIPYVLISSGKYWKTCCEIEHQWSNYNDVVNIWTCETNNPKKFSAKHHNRFKREICSGIQYWLFKMQWHKWHVQNFLNDQSDQNACGITGASRWSVQTSFCL